MEKILTIEEEDYALQANERARLPQKERGLLQLFILVLECFFFIPGKKK